MTLGIFILVMLLVAGYVLLLVGVWALLAAEPV